MNKQNGTIVSEQLFTAFSDQLGPYLKNVGVPEKVLSEPNVEFSESKFVELLQVAAQNSNEHVGLLLGSKIMPEHIGAIAHAAINAPTLEEGIEIISNYMVTYSHFSEVKWQQGESIIEITYRLNYPKIISKSQDAEFALSAILKLLSLRNGQRLTPKRVEFAHQKPSSTELHKEVFNCPVKFGAELNKIVIYKGLESGKAIKTDHRLFEILIAHLENQKKLRTRSDLGSQLSLLIEDNLGREDLSINFISKLVGSSVRTLQRRLSENDLDFSQLCDDVRQQLAMHYINDLNIPIVKVAEKIGYNDASSFTRAFKRWTGVAPKRYRMQRSSLH